MGLQAEFWRGAGVAVLLLLLVGCAYDPPVQGDRTTQKYKLDLGRCRHEGEHAQELIDGRTPWTQIVGLFTSDEPRRQAIRSCMQGKGYALNP